MISVVCTNCHDIIVSLRSEQVMLHMVVGNLYQLDPQPHLPGLDSFIWLSVWMRWLDVYHYGCELDQDDCVFPSMGANGIVQPHNQLSHDAIQKCINEATAGAGIHGSFSTHCF